MQQERRIGQRQNPVFSCWVWEPELAQPPYHPKKGKTSRLTHFGSGVSLDIVLPTYSFSSYDIACHDDDDTNKK